VSKDRVRHLVKELVARGIPQEAAEPIAKAESSSPIVYQCLSLLFRHHVTPEQMLGELISALLEHADTLQERLVDTLERSVTPVFLDSPH
jgi:cytochrome P450